MPRHPKSAKTKPAKPAKPKDAVKATSTPERAARSNGCLRDELLPHLLSGELSVTAIESAVAEVA